MELLCALFCQRSYCTGSMLIQIVKVVSFCVMLQFVKTLAKSPTFARNPREFQFETDMNRLFLFTRFVCLFIFTRFVIGCILRPQCRFCRPYQGFVHYIVGIRLAPEICARDYLIYLFLLFFPSFCFQEVILSESLKIRNES